MSYNESFNRDYEFLESRSKSDESYEYFIAVWHISIQIFTNDINCRYSSTFCGSKCRDHEYSLTWDSWRWIIFIFSTILLVSSSYQTWIELLEFIRRNEFLFEKYSWWNDILQLFLGQRSLMLWVKVFLNKICLNSASMDLSLSTGCCIIALRTEILIILKIVFQSVLVDLGGFLPDGWSEIGSECSR